MMSTQQSSVSRLRKPRKLIKRKAATRQRRIRKNMRHCHRALQVQSSKMLEVNWLARASRNWTKGRCEWTPTSNVRWQAARWSSIKSQTFWRIGECIRRLDPSPANTAMSAFRSRAHSIATFDSNISTRRRRRIRLINEQRRQNLALHLSSALGASHVLLENLTTNV